MNTEKRIHNLKVALQVLEAEQRGEKLECQYQCSSGYWKTNDDISDKLEYYIFYSILIRIKPLSILNPWTRATAPEVILLWSGNDTAPQVVKKHPSKCEYVSMDGGPISFDALSQYPRHYKWTTSLDGEKKPCGTWEEV